MSVLVAILVVFTIDAPRPPRAGAAEPLVRRGEAEQARGDPPPAPWDEVPILSDASELGEPLAGAVRDGLTAARSRIDRCFANEQKRAEERGPRPLDGAGDRGAPAVLLLRLTGRAGALDVDGVEVRAQGRVVGELVDCARRMLDGRALAVPRSVAGKRYRLTFVVP